MYVKLHRDKSSRKLSQTTLFPWFGDADGFISSIIIDNFYRYISFSYIVNKIHCFLSKFEMDIFKHFTSIFSYLPTYIFT